MKASNKKELYPMLQLEGDVYLPPMPQTNHMYVADVISDSKGKKRIWYLKYVKNSALKVIQVPHLPGLKINDILSFAREKLEIDQYLQKFKQQDKTPDRTWLCNLSKHMWQKLIVHTLFPQEFKKFVMDGVRKSELVHIKKKNYEIEISSEFSAIFKESEYFSSMLLIYTNI